VRVQGSKFPEKNSCIFLLVKTIAIYVKKLTIYAQTQRITRYMLDFTFRRIMTKPRSKQIVRKYHNGKTLYLAKPPTKCSVQKQVMFSDKAFMSSFDPKLPE
jgi:hypothetical protein